MQVIKIKTPGGIRTIGPGHPVFIVAEMSANHHHDFNQALELIDVASKAGVDAVKLQTYTADTLTIDSDKEYFQINVNEAWKGQSLYDLYKQTYTPWEWQPKLKQAAEAKGLILFSAPFDHTAVDFLEDMQVPLYKIASFELIDPPLLKRIGQTKKPVFMSRGMASTEEIEEAIKTLRESGCPAIAILHCISAYPAKSEEMNLAHIPDIAKRFDVVTGLSDHNLDSTVDLVAVGMGVSIIEKHYTLRRSDGGADAAFSLEPNELKDLVQKIRLAESSIGTATFAPGQDEKENIQFRRSLFAVNDIKKGEAFTSINIRSIRPGYGLAPKYYDEIIGKTASSDISRGTPLSWEIIKK